MDSSRFEPRTSATSTTSIRILTTRLTNHTCPVRYLACQSPAKPVRTPYLAFWWFLAKSVWFVSSLAPSFQNFLSESVSIILQDFRGSWRRVWVLRKSLVLQIRRFEYVIFAKLDLHQLALSEPSTVVIQRPSRLVIRRPQYLLNLQI